MIMMRLICFLNEECIFRKIRVKEGNQFDGYCRNQGDK